MPTESISRQDARRLALHAQMLYDPPTLSPGIEGVTQVVERLGYIQIDTIQAIRRAHHHVLWTRLPDYDPGMLYTSLAAERRVFEYWAHALSYVPMSDYRFYLPRMQRRFDPYAKWEENRFARYEHLFAPILERIRAQGPLTSSEISLPEGLTEGLSGRDPTKSALELLLLEGRLMVHERRAFERVYDLTKRVLPADVDTRVPAADEVARHFLWRALSAHGIARERDVREHIEAADKETLKEALADLVASGEIKQVTVEGMARTRFYALQETLMRTIAPVPPQVHLLSPFDNLVALRDRMKKLFEFDYALECYKPASKRKYGYFVLPVLWGDTLVGRFDPKADRKKKTLVIHSLVFEEGFEDYEGLLPALGAKLVELARFSDCAHVEIEQVSPESIRDPLVGHVRGMT